MNTNLPTALTFGSLRLDSALICDIFTSKRYILTPANAPRGGGGGTDGQMNERQQRILECLDQQGACTYHELAGKFAVSTMTIRRDVDALAEQGAAIKTLGGVQQVSVPSFLCEQALQTRLDTNKAEKRAIASQAVGLLKGQQTLFVDGSTTCWEFAKALARDSRGLTIVTNSALIAVESGQNRENAVVCLGGDYDPDSMSFVGPASEDAASRYFVDTAFFSTKGFMVDQGTFESVAANFRIKQTIARQARKVVLLVDHSKFGQRALCKVLDVSQIHTVVTDSQAPQADLAALRKRGCKVLAAGPRREAPVAAGTAG